MLKADPYEGRLFCFRVFGGFLKFRVAACGVTAARTVIRTAFSFFLCNLLTSKGCAKSRRGETISGSFLQLR